MTEKLTLKSIVNDYQNKFSHRLCSLEIGYKKVGNIIIKFDTYDLHHLLGLHYVTTLNATKSIDKIINDELKIENFKKHSEYRQMLSRVRNYKFIEKIFYSGQVKICILDKDLDKNTMKLNLIFFEINNRTAVVLGLRKIGDVYRLVTLHEASSKKYKSIKRTVIKEIRWL